MGKTLAVELHHVITIVPLGVEPQGCYNESWDNKPGTSRTVHDSKHEYTMYTKTSKFTAMLHK